MLSCIAACTGGRLSGAWSGKVQQSPCTISHPPIRPSPLSPPSPDVLELHPEVVEAARLYFELQPGTHGGRALTGDAAAVVPRLAGAGYDYIIHDVFRWA